MSYYVQQCKLVCGNTSTVSYIPQRYSIIGYQVYLRDNKKNWEGPYTVSSVGTELISIEQAEFNLKQNLSKVGRTNQYPEYYDE